MSDVIDRIGPAVLIIAITFAMLACSVERKVAREFIKNDSTRSVLVMPPDYLFKTSLKVSAIENADELEDWVLDSLLYEQSMFLKYIVDTVFLSDYHNTYCTALEELGFNVFGEDSLISFLNGKPDSYIFNLAQIELEEYIMPVVEKEVFDDYLYYQVFNLNAVNINSWIEVNKINVEEKKELFFSSLYLTDELEGNWKYNYLTGVVKSDIQVDTLMLDVVYQLSELAGKLYASYTFDYLMNLYIDKRMEEEGLQRSGIYYHYNRDPRFLVPAEEDQRFILMDE